MGLCNQTFFYLIGLSIDTIFFLQSLFQKTIEYMHKKMKNKINCHWYLRFAFEFADMGWSIVDLFNDNNWKKEKNCDFSESFFLILFMCFSSPASSFNALNFSRFSAHIPICLQLWTYLFFSLSLPSNRMIEREYKEKQIPKKSKQIK